ncbi:MAG: hypothetical protein KBD50_00785 [Candidatus Pacebacteria bacterium]|nr:hypothetical protein [Candidatus Paceibacterota bacterium]
MKYLLLTAALVAALGATSVGSASAGNNNRLTQTENNTLKGLLDKMHGTATMTGKWNGYRGDKPGYIPPPPGCKEHTVYDARQNRYFVRWYSPTNPNC